MIEFETKQKRLPFVKRYISNKHTENQWKEHVICSNIKKYTWIINDGGWNPEPFFIVYCSESITNKIEYMDNEDKLYFIANMLYKTYPKQFPELFNNHELRRDLLYYNILEDYNKTYERMIEEQMAILRDRFYYYDEKNLINKAKYHVNQLLESLSVFVI